MQSVSALLPHKAPHIVVALRWASPALGTSKVSEKRVEQPGVLYDCFNTDGMFFF